MGAVPQVLVVVVCIMVVVLLVLFVLVYKKRRESLNLKPQIERMSRSLKRISTKKSSSQDSSSRKLSPVFEKQVPFHRETNFWVPEVRRCDIFGNITENRLF